MKASIILLSWNGIKYLGPCLDAVFAQQYEPFEVIVVDNGSSDGSADYIAQAYPAARLIRLPENTGYSGGNNVGMRAATGEALILLNQDTQVHSGWLAALMEPLKDPSVGFVGCKTLYPDGTLQHAGGYLIDARGNPAHYGWREPDEGQYDAPQEVAYVTGAAIALRRSTLVQIGFLDEAFSPAYFEDSDWCFRAHAAGLSVLYWPAASLVHDESPKDGYRQQTVYHHGRLRLLFKHKPLTWLQGEFATAEVAWARALGRTREMQAVRDAYLRILLSLSDIFAYRTGPFGPGPKAASASADDLQREWSALVQLVRHLRDVTAADGGLELWESENGEQSLAPGISALPRLLADLVAQGAVEEQPFRSNVPILGNGIVAFREAWNNVSTRWYVLPLLQQQVAFNATVRDTLLVILKELAQTQRDIDRVAAALRGHNTDAGLSVEESRESESGEP